MATPEKLLFITSITLLAFIISLLGAVLAKV
jgi:hypothetical protein